MDTWIICFESVPNCRSHFFPFPSLPEFHLTILCKHTVPLLRIIPWVLTVQLNALLYTKASEPVHTSVHTCTFISSSLPILQQNGPLHTSCLASSRPWYASSVQLVDAPKQRCIHYWLLSRPSGNLHNTILQIKLHCEIFWCAQRRCYFHKLIFRLTHICTKILQAFSCLYVSRTTSCKATHQPYLQHV